MEKEDYKICREIKGQLSKIIAIIDIRAFGSRARGATEEDSDLDLFIEVEKNNKTIKNKIRNIVWKIGLKYSIVISILIFSRYDIENSPLRSSPIVKNIMSEGITL